VTLGADAYVWGYPLVAMHRTRARHGAPSRGRLLRRDGLATAADRTVVAPNNDTLYASGWYDLRLGDLGVEVDAMDSPARYWSVMLLDAYTNVTYVCRRLHGTDGTRVRVVLDPETHPTPDRAVDPVPMATPTVWVLVRVVVDGPDDLPAARDALSRVRVLPATNDGGLDDRADDRTTDFFDVLRAGLAIDPPAPWHPPPPEELAAWLADLPAGDELDAARRDGEARVDAGVGVDRTRNGWGTRGRGAAFGDDVAYRAAFAKISLAGHLPVENRSYTRRLDGTSTRQLRFGPGDEPPVGAFWSLTMYGPDLFFVDNPIDRYSVGDRTAGLRREPDGSLVVPIGHERPADDANWLPAPAGPCFVALRGYEGAPAIVAAEWFPPDLEPLD
jgi:hypothetical protein